MSDGLLAQEFGNFDRSLPEAFQYAQGYNNVLEKALDTIALRKQQALREQYNNLMMDKAQQMSPLDIMKAKAEAAKAQAMSTPEILQSGQEGYKAQNLLQQIAARRKQETEQSDIEAALAENKAATGKNKLLGQLSSGIDLQYNQNAPESMRTSAALQNNALADSLARLDPSFLQKMWLQDDKLAALLEQIRTKSEVAPQKPEKAPTMSQMEAKYRDILARDPNNEEAKTFLADLEGYKQRTAAGMADVTLKDGKLVSKREALGSASAAPKEYNYVPGKGLVPAQ